MVVLKADACDLVFGVCLRMLLFGLVCFVGVVMGLGCGFVLGGGFVLGRVFWGIFHPFAEGEFCWVILFLWVLGFGVFNFGF